MYKYNHVCVQYVFTRYVNLILFSVSGILVVVVVVVTVLHQKWPS